MPAITFKPRVKETSTTTGTGNITLAGAVVGYQSFDDGFVVTDDYFHYCIEGVDGSGVPTGQWEEGIGHLSASTTLVRDTLLNSSTGSAVSFSAGTKNVFCTVAASHFRQAAVLESDFSKTNNTLDNVSDFTFTFQSGHWYQIEGRLVVQNGPGQAQFDLNGGTATITGMQGGLQFLEDGSPNAYVGVTALTGFTGSSLGNDGYTNLVSVDAAIQCNAGGTLIFRFSQSGTFGTPSLLLKYSTLTCTDITPG